MSLINELVQVGNSEGASELSSLDKYSDWGTMTYFVVLSVKVMLTKAQNVVTNKHVVGFNCSNKSGKLITLIIQT